MNIRQVRKKIKTVGNVKKITRAMQLVSAIKMRKAQQKALEGRPYLETLDNILSRILTKVDIKLSGLLSEKKADKELAIIISSNKGLCGAFNFNLFRFVTKNIDFDRSEFILLGKKGALLTIRLGGKIIADFSSNEPLTAVSAIFNMALSKFLTEEYKAVYLVYNKFISTLRSEPIKEKILPVKISKQDLANIKKEEEYLIEPRPELIVDPLLRSFIEEKIRGAIMSHEAGEHSARMMAMKSATDNANDLTYELTLLRNKLRQEKITNELLDMITAKESVEAE